MADSDGSSARIKRLRDDPHHPQVKSIQPAAAAMWAVAPAAAGLPGAGQVQPGGFWMAAHHHHHHGAAAADPIWTFPSSGGAMYRMPAVGASITGTGVHFMPRINLHSPGIGSHAPLGSVGISTGPTGSAAATSLGLDLGSGETHLGMLAHALSAYSNNRSIHNSNANSMGPAAHDGRGDHHRQDNTNSDQ